MTTHRFYIGNVKDKSGPLELNKHVWLNDRDLTKQILNVLRMRIGEKLILFDGNGTEKLYQIDKIEPFSVGLIHVTDIVPIYPKKKIILGFSLLKKDKNEWKKRHDRALLRGLIMGCWCSCCFLGVG